MNEVLRQERKFLITQEQFYIYSRDLAKIMIPDAHNRGDGYPIRSLYYDSLDDRDFEEKEDGIELRRKIRLRNYGPDSSFALLEMKQKEGADQKKRSARLDKEDAKKLIACDYSPLLFTGDDFGAECYTMMNLHCYRPKAIVEYKRMAFIAKENKIRVTFDHHIVGSESNFDIFDHELQQFPLLDPYLVVLEVKYNGFLLSYIKDMLAKCDSSEISVGKYALSRTISKHFNF
ncbi:MAG: polyphosphate polymerase domain-containing protein [Erysipelotrichaceae bacterium]|nr:polyphosphate polymerase domain-containing protein [Erysipelotrichaceae bacterium]